MLFEWLYNHGQNGLIEKLTRTKQEFFIKENLLPIIGTPPIFLTRMSLEAKLTNVNVVYIVLNSGVEWKKPRMTNCQSESVPLNETIISTTPSSVTSITKKILSQISKPVYLLDIWMLTRFRIDGHPAGYNIFTGDCTHWCLAGVPDTWNIILSAALLKDT